MVFYAEGGGGCPGADWDASPGFDLATFHAWGKLSGLVPLVEITTGRCVAGNAAILGCCDVIIATEGSNVGMGGPAMIEGGGLGVFKPEDVGPLEVQVPNGVVDIVVADEATTIANKYLSYFQGRIDTWEVHDQRELRHVVPENRLRVYDVRRVIELVCDVDSVLELRSEFGLAMVTAFARVEGRPVGIIANKAMHLGGAIDGDASDKASPMFVTGSNLGVLVFMLVLRKSYGLGALGMAAGSFGTPIWLVSWPTGEFGGMGLEGFVRLTCTTSARPSMSQLSSNSTMSSIQRRPDSGYCVVCRRSAIITSHPRSVACSLTPGRACLRKERFAHCVPLSMR